MFLYLIELYIAGVLLFHLLNSKLPSAIQAVSGILLGYLLHVLNSMALIGVGIGLTQTSVVILISVECLGFLIGLIVKQKSAGQLRKVFSLGFWVVGLIYFGLLYLFYKLNLSFITNDSLYLILMGKDLIRSGFKEWYYASPGWTGLYIPMIQTIGMIFSVEYVWFIQPVMSLIFIAAFLYFAHRSVSRFISRKWASIALTYGGLLMFLSSNLPFVMLFYIHTNFLSSLFLFLAVMGLYFAIEEKNDGYLNLSLISLISFSFLRIENVIIALAIIFYYLASGRLSLKQSIKAFIPYLVFQVIWLLGVYSMEIDSYLDSLSKWQLLVMAGACMGMIIIVLISQSRFLKSFLQLTGKLLPFVFLAGWAILAARDPESLIINFRSIGTNMFISGNWGLFWWGITVLALISLFHSKFPQKEVLIRIIVSFVMIIHILGFFRHPYHNLWYDSANRMMIHIAPLVLFFVITQVAKASSLSKALPEADETPKAA